MVNITLSNKRIVAKGARPQEIDAGAQNQSRDMTSNAILSSEFAFLSMM